MSTNKSLPTAGNPWTTKSKKPVYDNPWIYIEEHEVLTPGGSDGIYGVVHYKNLAIGIIPFDGTHTWLIGQYRYPMHRYSWEIPAGGGPEGEDVLGSAKRELLEETGITAGRWDLIQHMQLSNSTSDELAQIFLARDLSFGKSEPTDEEELHIVKVPLKEAFERVHSGELTDSMTVAGLQKLELMILRGELAL